MRLRRILKDARVLVIQPGDVIVIELPGRVTAQAAQAIKDGMRDRLVGISDVLVLGNDAKIAAVYRCINDLRKASA